MLLIGDYCRTGDQSKAGVGVGVSGFGIQASSGRNGNRSLT